MRKNIFGYKHCKLVIFLYLIFANLIWSLNSDVPNIEA